MTIVACPSCGKRISSLAALCSHCGHQTGEVSDDDLATMNLRNIRDRIFRLNMYSYAVITAFVAGFGWYWWDTAGFQEAASSGPWYAMGISAVAYLVIRGLLFRARQAMRKARNY